MPKRAIKFGTTNSRSQAGLEFIMTYGWAIMLVLVAIGILAYFGILEPDGFLPRRCAFQPGISCTDFKITEDSMTLVLRNGKGEDIQIEGIQVKNCIGTSTGDLKNGEQNTFIIDGCSNIPDTKFIGNATVTYTGANFITHRNTGNIVGLVEPGNSLQVPTGSFYWITTTQSEFDQGSYISAQSIPQGSAQLAIGETSGTYVSKIFDANKTAVWNNLSWDEQLSYGDSIKPNGTSCSDSDLKALWSLEEISGLIADSSFCASTGNKYGGTPGVGGKINRAYNFDAASSYINFSNPQSLNFSNLSSFTVTAWINASDKQASWPIVYWGGGMSSYMQLSSPPYIVGGLYCLVTTDTGLYYNTWPPGHSSTGSMFDNKWHHIGCVYTGTAILGYVDGALRTGSSASGKVITPTDPIYVGASGANSNMFNGTIDEVSVWNRSLSTDDIMEQYQLGILNLYFEARSCDDALCDDEPFLGIFTNPGAQSLNVSNNRYFQYRATFNTDKSAYTPVLDSVTVGYTKS